MINNKPKISVITVVYSDKIGLEKTIQSVINQTYDNIEYIIIDGGSSDGTVDVIKKYEAKIDYWVSEKDNGIYDAMNKGIVLAKGKYLLFLNAGDNFALKELLQNIINKINALEVQPKVIYGGSNVFTEDGTFLSKLNPLVLNKKNLNRYATRTVCHQSIFVNRDNIPLYSDKYRLKGELNWYYELVENFKEDEMLNIDEIVCDYYLGGTGDKNFFENYFERINVTRKHNNRLTFIGLIPFFLVPFIFRIRRIVFGK